MREGFKPGEKLRGLRNELLIHRFHMFSSAAFICTIPNDHRKIVEALKTKEPARITDAVREHFKNGTAAAAEWL